VAELSTLARPYARAAFQYALGVNDLAGWARQLAILASVSQHDKLRPVMASPALSATQQAQIFADVCGDELATPVRNFVELLAQNKRLTLLPEIYRQFGELKTAQEQAVDIELTTAIALDESSQNKLAKALETRLARRVNIQTVVDQRLLAGVIIKAGDLVIDGSVRGRLEKLAKAINS
jgi:F-type H+-transporting ATPase subunit delta